MSVNRVAFSSLPDFFGFNFAIFILQTQIYTAMIIKDLLLNGNSFLMLLKQYAIDVADVQIKDEDVLVDQFRQHPQLSKGSVCIEGKNKDGIINFFGTIHYNLMSKLAVFEMQDFEQTPVQQLN